MSTINSLAAITSSFQSSCPHSTPEDDEIISSSRSRASVLAALRARHLASVVAYSRFGKFAITPSNEINFSLVVMRDCLSGNKLISKEVLSGGEGLEWVLFDRHAFVRDWVVRVVRKDRDCRICFGLEDCRQ